MVKLRWMWRLREYASVLLVLLELMLTHGKEEPGDAPPIISSGRGMDEGGS
jgi:hypothetical protein